MGSIEPRVLFSKNRKKINIRCALTSNAGKLRRFMFKISKERIFSMIEPEEFKETIASYKRRIRRFNDSPGKIFLIAEHNKKIIGLVQFDNFDMKKNRHNGFLTIFVSKNWREKGIGKILMKALLNWAKQNKMIEKVSLSVFSTNKRAIKLYKKMGFKQEGRCRNDMKINGRYVDSVLMYKFVK